MAKQSIFIKILRVVRIVLTVSSSASIVLAFGWSIYVCIQAISSTRVEGQIVAMQERYDSENDATNYVPVYRFQAKDGKSYTVASNTGSNPAEFSVGQSVRVLYHQSNPQGASIDSFLQQWLVPLVLLLIGIIHGAIAGFCFWIERRQRAKAIVTPSAAY